MVEDDATIAGFPTLRHQVLEKTPYLVVLTGTKIADRYLLQSQKIVIGRSPSVEIFINESNVSRYHAQITTADGETTIEDLGSTNGTLVNDRPIESARRLDDGDIIAIGATIFRFSLLSEVENLFHEEVVDGARVDLLTGLLTRRQFFQMLDAECNRIRRYGGVASLLMCDLDKFKSINDCYGHPAGDLVLRRVAETMTSNIRNNLDIGGRYGGEELVLLLPGTEMQRAWILADRIRALIEGLAIEYHQNRLQVTISIGIAAASQDKLCQPQELLEAADRKLYDAKRNGRNQIAS